MKATPIADPIRRILHENKLPTAGYYATTAVEPYNEVSVSAYEMASPLSEREKAMIMAKYFASLTQENPKNRRCVIL